MADFKIRAFDREKDESFLFDSWLKSYKYMSKFAEKIAPEIYFPFHRMIVKGIFDRPTTTVLIAHPEGDPEVIIGYVVAESRMNAVVIHYVCVKEAFRKLGIAKALIQALGVQDPAGLTFTHWTYPMNAIIHKIPGLKYNPYLI